MTDSVLDIEVVRENSSCPVIRLEGELDASTAPDLKSTVLALVTEGCRDLVIDMERLYLLDSLALGVLMSACQRVPGKLTIQNPTPPVRRVLDAGGVSRLIEVRDEAGEHQQLLNFGITIEDTTEGIPMVYLRGELDAYSAAHFRGALISLTQEGHRFVVLHLGALDFIDSVGLGSMVSIYTRLKKAGGSFYIAAPSEQISKVLHITGLDALFPLYASDAEAMAAAARVAAGSA
ncbi:MAG TPA: STAS domain-containing protein [Armatimonadetes bacterium]|jgi:anti-anti-sigma factor|nr:STAS domain-containing protein [Armatimonadota bacterium]